VLVRKASAKKKRREEVPASARVDTRQPLRARGAQGDTQGSQVDTLLAAAEEEERSRKSAWAITATSERVKGFLELTADGRRFKAIEVRESPRYGGPGGRGVFVKAGYTLRQGARIPYFGTWIHELDIDWKQAEYVVGPIANGMCVNGDPAVVENERHRRDSQLWAGALVNQANLPEEKNCIIRAVRLRSGYKQRESYQAQCTHEVRCAIEITRTLREGEELLTNYAWSIEHQYARRCGYDFYAERHLQQPRREKPIEDIDLGENNLGEGSSEEDMPGIGSTSKKR
jgi:hypothetical protein